MGKGVWEQGDSGTHTGFFLTEVWVCGVGERVVKRDGKVSEKRPGGKLECQAQEWVSS